QCCRFPHPHAPKAPVNGFLHTSDIRRLVVLQSGGINDVMSSTLVIVLNLIMSFVAISSVAAGWLIARRLRPALPPDAGRAHRRGLVRPLRFYYRAPASIA